MAIKLKSSIKQALASLPLSIRQHPLYWHKLLFLKQAERFDSEQIRNYQFCKLKKILSLAYTKTPGYREHFRRHSFNPDKHFKCLEDIQHVPLIDKSLLRDNIEDFTIPHLLNRVNHTGGSRGRPLKFYLNRRVFAEEWAFMRSCWMRVGWKLGDVGATLRGTFISEDLYNFDKYRNEVDFSSSHLTPQHINTIYKVFQHYQPQHLQAYPSMLSRLVDLLQERGLDLKIPLILLGSENIYSFQLQKFKDYFADASIYYWYGHSEKAVFAPLIPGSTVYEPHPCYGFTELLDKNQNPVAVGESGEIVATGFINNATLFIRYRTEDIARRADSSQVKGIYNTHMHWSEIVGRQQDVLVTREGRRISGVSLAIQGIYSNFAEYQFFQTQPGSVLLRYVPVSRGVSASEAEAIQSHLNKKFGPDICFELQEVPEIPKTSSGKQLFIDQNIPLD